jgi:hypothetical protein
METAYNEELWESIPLYWLQNESWICSFIGAWKKARMGNLKAKTQWRSCGMDEKVTHDKGLIRIDLAAACTA